MHRRLRANSLRVHRERKRRDGNIAFTMSRFQAHKQKQEIPPICKEWLTQSPESSSYIQSCPTSPNHTAHQRKGVCVKWGKLKIGSCRPLPEILPLLSGNHPESSVCPPGRGPDLRASCRSLLFPSLQPYVPPSTCSFRLPPHSRSSHPCFSPACVSHSAITATPARTYPRKPHTKLHLKQKHRGKRCWLSK